ncbi:MAG: hypothetical protein U0169_27495 [Polyangiaceae bacterium]
MASRSSLSSGLVSLGSLALVGVLQYGCTIKTTDTAEDGGTSDSGSGADGGSTAADGGTKSDGGSKTDASVDTDAGTTTDAGGSDAKSDAKVDGGVTGDGGANACSPQTVSSVPAYVPSPVRSGACTAQQLVDYRAACFDGDDTTCMTWVQNSANDNCYSCDGDISTKSSWGVITGFTIGAEDHYELNLGGWVQTLDPSKQACAEKLQSALQCKIASCATKCPIPGQQASDQEYNDAIDALDACLTGSNSTTCKTYYDQTTCLQAEMNNPLLAPVFNYVDAQNDNEANDAYFQVLAAMCGPQVTDAGAGEGGTSDASDGGSDN